MAGSIKKRTELIRAVVLAQSTSPIKIDLYSLTQLDQQAYGFFLQATITDEAGKVLVCTWKGACLGKTAGVPAVSATQVGTPDAIGTIDGSNSVSLNGTTNYLMFQYDNVSGLTGLDIFVNGEIYY